MTGILLPRPRDQNDMLQNVFQQPAKSRSVAQPAWSSAGSRADRHFVNTAPEKLLRPTWVEVSLPKLGRNARRVRELAGKKKVMAVVKADAYGHGAVPVAKALAASGVDWFGVATAEEALELRRAGIEQPILLLGGLYMSDPADLVEHRLTPSVSSTARLDTYAACARRFAKPIEFHLKIDTGMGRLGLPPDRLRAFVEHYRELEGLELAGLLTHLASAEDRVGTQTVNQLQRFARSLRALGSMGVEPRWIHVSNSAALLTGRKPASENLFRATPLSATGRRSTRAGARASPRCRSATPTASAARFRTEGGRSSVAAPPRL